MFDLTGARTRKLESRRGMPSVWVVGLFSAAHFSVPATSERMTEFILSSKQWSKIVRSSVSARVELKMVAVGRIRSSIKDPDLVGE